MYFLNEYEVETIARRAVQDRSIRPNVAQGAEILENLMVWANRNSDGWAYWPNPMRAAAKLGRMLELRAGMVRHDQRLDSDITDAELRSALAPIKSLLTRQGVDHAEVGL